MHWPVAQSPEGPLFSDKFEDIPLIDTWRAMEVSIFLKNI